MVSTQYLALPQSLDKIWHHFLSHSRKLILKVCYSCMRLKTCSVCILTAAWGILGTLSSKFRDFWQMVLLPSFCIHCYVTRSKSDWLTYWPFPFIWGIWWLEYNTRRRVCNFSTYQWYLQAKNQNNVDMTMTTTKKLLCFTLYQHILYWASVINKSWWWHNLKMKLASML